MGIIWTRCTDVNVGQKMGYVKRTFWGLGGLSRKSDNLCDFLWSEE